MVVVMRMIILVFWAVLAVGQADHGGPCTQTSKDCTTLPPGTLKHKWSMKEWCALRIDGCSPCEDCPTDRGGGSGGGYGSGPYVPLYLNPPADRHGACTEGIALPPTGFCPIGKNEIMCIAPTVVHVEAFAGATAAEQRKNCLASVAGTTLRCVSKPETNVVLSGQDAPAIRHKGLCCETSNGEWCVSEWKWYAPGSCEPDTYSCADKSAKLVASEDGTLHLCHKATPKTQGYKAKGSWICPSPCACSGDANDPTPPLIEGCDLEDGLKVKWEPAESEK